MELLFQVSALHDPSRGYRDETRKLTALFHAELGKPSKEIET